MSILNAFALVVSLAFVSPAAMAHDYDQDVVVEAEQEARDSGGAGRARKPNCERIRNFTQCVNTTGCRPSTNESNQVTPWTCLEE